MFRNTLHAFAPTLLTFTLVTALAVNAAPQSSAQDAGGPPWGDWLQYHLQNDILLRDPFKQEPLESPKGLASHLKARERDIINRIDALQYLARFHCGTFPEARDVIVSAMLTDKWEQVRLAAVAALCVMCQNCNNGTCAACCYDENGNCNVAPCCVGQGEEESYWVVEWARGDDDEDKEEATACAAANTVDEEDAKMRVKNKDLGIDIDRKGNWVTEKNLYDTTPKPSVRQLLKAKAFPDKWIPTPWKKYYAQDYRFSQIPTIMADPVLRSRYGHPDPDDPAHCACCCDANVLNALAKIAYEIKENGCPYEPSRRVREAAVEAIKASGIPCCYEPYKVGEEQGPPAYIPAREAQQQQKTDDGGEFVPPTPKELQPTPSEGGPVLSVPPMTKAEPISRLSNICLVSLRHGERAAPSPRFSSTYRGRVYYFASADAKREFDSDPEANSVAFGGCDPVHYVENRQVLEGRFLVLHEDRFYMFATPENYETFKQNAARYTGKPSTDPAARPSELALAAPLK
ncbi:MAG: hypothetical protein KDA89_18705 [Planctomycetaceae bacterium]|nr:hypothetical protein [Planctomycetaceae bacterium]